MDDLKKNKKIIFFCILIIIFVILGVYLSNQAKIMNSSGLFDDREPLINKYEANQYIPVYISEEEVMKKYLNDFKNTMLNDTEAAYYLLNEEYRNLKYDGINDFINYVDEIRSVKLYQLTADKYTVKNINGSKFFDIVGSDGNRYIIKENSIMNYEVFLDNYTMIIE